MRYRRRLTVVDAVQFLIGMTPLPQGVWPVVISGHGFVREIYTPATPVSTDCRTAFAVMTTDGWKLISHAQWVVTHQFGQQTVWSERAFEHEFEPITEPSDD